MSILSAKNIEFGYDESLLLHDLSLALRDGERIALLGDNGSGKTTLSLILAGIIHPRSGKVMLDNIDCQSDWGRLEFRRRIGYVFQNPEDGFVASDISRELAFGAENIALPPEMLRERVHDLIERFDLDSESHSPLALSGGMKARLAIASVLATGAEFIVLDEPESFLDYRGQIALEEAISDIRIQSGILHITQSGDVVRRCDRAFTIDKGCIRAVDESDFTASIPNIHIESHPDSETFLTADKLSFGYNGEPALTDISFSIHRGECIGLVGASGSGKTTLALLCAGLLNSPAGNLIRDVRASISLQFPERQLFAETVIDDVKYGPINFNFPDTNESAEQALAMVGLDKSLWQMSPFILSDGQQRRAGLAGVIAVKPNLLILDEPFASLDSEGIQCVVGIISQLIQQNTAVIIITHRTDILSKIAARTIALFEKRVIYDGKTDELLCNSEFCDRIGIRAV